MSSEARELRQRIGTAIQADGPDFDGGLRPGAVAICVGWVVVAEWMDTDGLKWLSKNSGDSFGEPLTTWAMNGMLHEALHGLWPGSIEED